jgi:hypothetical protein
LRPIKLVFFEIERKTDILAFAAFLLGLSSVVYQGIGRLTGPNIELLPVRQITLVARPIPDSDEKSVSYVATMAYVNTGQVGYNDAVTRERLEFKLNKKEKVYTADWHKFVSFNETKDFIAEGKSVGAVVVNAGSAEAHETWFASRTDDNLVYLNDFSLAFEELLKDNNKVIKWQITFFSETIKDGEINDICNVMLSGRRLQALRDPKIGWLSLNCQR